VAILDYAAQERVMAQYLYEHAGVPTDGTNGTYAHVALPGALLIDTDAKTLYQNTGTQASPVWTERSAASGGGSGPLVFASVSLTAAQVRVIGDTPITLVAGVVGEAHPLVSWGSTYRAGNQAFSNGANIVLGVGPVANGWYENSFNHAAAASALQGTDDILRARGMAFNDSYGSDIPLAQVEEQPICYLLEPSSAPNTPFSGGNGTLLLWVIYARIPTA
jgi:hypothetical protein